MKVLQGTRLVVGPEDLKVEVLPEAPKLVVSLGRTGRIVLGHTLNTL